MYHPKFGGMWFNIFDITRWDHLKSHRSFLHLSLLYWILPFYGFISSSLAISFCLTTVIYDRITLQTTKNNKSCIMQNNYTFIYIFYEYLYAGCNKPRYKYPNHLPMHNLKISYIDTLTQSTYPHQICHIIYVTSPQQTYCCHVPSPFCRSFYETAMYYCMYQSLQLYNGDNWSTNVSKNL